MNLTELVVRTFVPDRMNTHDPAVRTRYGLVASIACIACNVALCLGKGIVGLAVGSVSIVADAVNNLSDASSNVVSLAGFKLASKPADADHPYGHGRFEYLAGLAVAVLVCAIGVNLVWESVNKILHPEPTEFGPAVIVVLVASIAVKLWMASFNRTIGGRIDSETLRATAADSRNDVLTTSAVLIAAAVSAYTGRDLDGWAGLVVGVFVCVSGIGLVRDTVSPLLGQAPDEELVERVRDKILSYPGVLGTHDLMIHDYGPGRKFASAHVEMAGEGDAFANHDLLDHIEQDFGDELGLVMTLHYDPIVTNDPEVHDMRHWIDLHVRRIDARLSIHDLRCEGDAADMTISFDCIKPAELAMTDEELLGRIRATVAERWPDAACEITLDSGYMSSAQ